MSTKETEELAKKLSIPLFRTCTKDNVMVTELFEYLAVKFFSKELHKNTAHTPISTVDEIR